MKLFKIGSNSRCDIVLNSPYVSGLHAELTSLPEGNFILEDKNSTMVLPCPASFFSCSLSGTGVRPSALVIMTVWLTPGRVYSARSAAAAPQNEDTPGVTS